MFLSDKYKDSFRELFAEAKSYMELQKRYAAVETAEKLTTVLSAIAIAAVCILILSIVLLFSSFALAYWIGALTGSMATGFISVTAINLLLLLIFFLNRRRWVILPIARLITTVFTCSMELGQEKEELQKEIHSSRSRISETMHEIMDPMPKATSKVQGFGNMITSIMAVYEGIQMGRSIVSAFRSFFGKKR